MCLLPLSNNSAFLKGSHQMCFRPVCSRLGGREPCPLGTGWRRPGLLDGRLWPCLLLLLGALWDQGPRWRAAGQTRVCTDCHLTITQPHRPRLSARLSWVNTWLGTVHSPGDPKYGGQGSAEGPSERPTALYSLTPALLLTHSFIHSLLHSLSHSLTHSFSHSFTHSFIH